MAHMAQKLALVAAVAAGLPVVGAACTGNGSPEGFSDAALDTGRQYPRDAAVPLVDSTIVQPDSGPDVNDASEELSFNMWSAAPGPIRYWGGPVMLNSPSVYFIWYGDWSGSTTPAILEDLIRDFSPTQYSDILTGYYQVPQPVRIPDAGLEASADAAPDIIDSGVPDGPRTYVNGRYTFAGSTYVTYTRGKDLQDTDISALVADLLNAGSLPHDPNAIYFVLTSSDVSEGSPFGLFCEDFCGWHESTFIGGLDIKYAFVGDPITCLGSCSAQPQFAESGILNSPNGDWTADSMASVIIHELSEATTDPDPAIKSWLDESQGQEIGDMCAWRFDPTYPTNAGSRANVRFGSRDFLIQQMWVNDNDGGRCDLHR